MLALLHISMHGLASAGCSGGGGGGEMDSLYQVREDVADECFKSNTDDLVGFKVRESPPHPLRFSLTRGH